MRLFSANISESVESKLVEYAFGEKNILIAGSLCNAAVAAFAFQRTHVGWFIVWGIAAFLLLLVRLAMMKLFERRRLRSGRYRSWQVWFVTGASLNGALIGIGGACSILWIEPFTQMLVITMISGFVMGAAARIAVVPAAAIGCIASAEVPIVVACLASRNIYFALYTILVIVSMLIAFSVVRNLYIQTVEFLSAGEERAQLNDELARANMRLEHMASTDALTGVANRRRFNDVLRQETGRLGRDAGYLSLLMLDVDFFKPYNDRYGHTAGDAVLCRIAAEASACLRRSADVFARYGGEEFVAVLPETDGDAAVELAEIIRARIESLQLENLDASPPFLTVSIGVATIPPGAVGGPQYDLVARADEALYAAKAAGRNRVRSPAATLTHRHSASIGSAAKAL